LDRAVEQARIDTGAWVQPFYLLEDSVSGTAPPDRRQSFSTESDPELQEAVRATEQLTECAGPVPACEGSGAIVAVTKPRVGDDGRVGCWVVVAQSEPEYSATIYRVSGVLEGRWIVDTFRVAGFEN